MDQETTRKPVPAADEDEEYLSVVWGILRRPIACTRCGQLTRTPSYWSGDQPVQQTPSGTSVRSTTRSPPICGACFRISIWGH